CTCCANPWHSSSEDTTGNGCLNTPGGTTCGGANITPSPCAWETGNINDSGTPGPWEYGSCHYRDVPPGNYSFECRLHVFQPTPMTGMLVVVSPIKLTLTRGAGGAAVLSWTGGSSTGPWDVFKDSTPGTAQKMLAPTRLSPAAGQATRSLTDSACTP